MRLRVLIFSLIIWRGLFLLTLAFFSRILRFLEVCSVAKVVAVGGVQLFINGWFCPKCDCVTEHVEVKGNLRCSECGFAKPINKHKDEVSAKKRAYYEAHKDEVSAKKRAWREAHKDEVSAKKRAYYEAHKDEVSAKKRAYYEAHKDEVSAKKRAYYEAHKDEVSAKQRAW